MTSSASDSLERELARLPRDVTPARDLWPGIAIAIGRPRRPWLLAVAASVATACLATAITWVVLHRDSEPAVVVGVTPAQAFDDPTDAHYVRARNALERTYRERLALLTPATRARVEENLAIIRQAHEDIRKALAADPASPVLEDLLQSTLRDELDLYENVIQATQPAMTRT